MATKSKENHTKTRIGKNKEKVKNHYLYHLNYLKIRFPLNSEHHLMLNGLDGIYHVKVLGYEEGQPLPDNPDEWDKTKPFIYDNAVIFQIIKD